MPEPLAPLPEPPHVDNPRHRCAVYTRGVGADPVGTAGAYDGFLLVEHPLPWPAELTDLPALAPVAEAAAAAGGRGFRWRIQGLASPGPPGAGRAADTVTVVAYRRDPSAPFVEYAGADHVVARADLTDLCVALVEAAPERPLDHAGGRPHESAAPGSVRDLLVCTHGSRDVCCGTSGPPLLDAAAGRVGAARVWRTSHTGGHRFAPTAVELPAGRLWAWLDEDVLDRVVGRTGDAAEVVAHDRGGAAFPTPAAQAAERAVLARRGWTWLGAARRVEEVEHLDQGRRTRVRLEWSHGREAGAYEALVEVTRVIPTLVCGRPPADAEKSAPELRVVELHELPA